LLTVAEESANFNTQHQEEAGLRNGAGFSVFKIKIQIWKSKSNFQIQIQNSFLLLEGCPATQ